LYYGWIVLGVAFGIGFFTAGINQAFGIFVKPMTDDYGWSRADISLAVSIFAVISAMVPPLAGRISDRFGPRLVLTIGVLLNALGMILMSQVDTLLKLYLVYGVLIGAGFGFTGFAAIAGLLSQWFVRRRGMAMSISATGLGIGQLILAPLMTYFIIRFSWQTAFFIIGVLSIVLIPLCYVTLKRRAPASADEDVPYVEGAAEQPVDCITNEMIRQDLNIAWTTRSFWLLASGFMACGFTIYFLTAHMVALAVDRGISSQAAGTALGIAGGTVIFSNLVIGALSDRLPRKHVLAMLYGMRAVAVALLFVADSTTVLYLFALLFGLSRANAPVVTAAIVDIYGRRAVGSIVGYLTMFHQLFAAAGAFFGGLVYDSTGSYNLMLWISIAILINGTVASLFVRDRRETAARLPDALPAAAGAGD
jgi:MFS family permease